MQKLGKYLIPNRNLKIERFLRKDSKFSHRINNIKTIKTVTFPIATELLNQRFFISNKFYSNFSTTEDQLVDAVKFEKVCEETLESLSEYFEDLIENSSHLKAADVNYSSGVLTVKFGEPYGTYVINRQSPNKQIWLSSPISGPKRYEFISNGQYWLYKHDGKTLHQLLQSEISKIVTTEVDFAKCLYSHSVSNIY